MNGRSRFEAADDFIKHTGLLRYNFPEHFKITLFLNTAPLFFVYFIFFSHPAAHQVGNIEGAALAPPDVPYCALVLATSWHERSFLPP